MVTIVPPAIGPCEGAMPSIRGCCASAAAQMTAKTSEARNADVDWKNTAKIRPKLTRRLGLLDDPRPLGCV
jgi:hypothetical protein